MELLSDSSSAITNKQEAQKKKKVSLYKRMGGLMVLQEITKRVFLNIDKNN